MNAARNRGASECVEEIVLGRAAGRFLNCETTQTRASSPTAATSATTHPPLQSSAPATHGDVISLFKYLQFGKTGAQFASVERSSQARPSPATDT
jgi:hypothetical protein